MEAPNQLTRAATARHLAAIEQVRHLVVQSTTIFEAQRAAAMGESLRTACRIAKDKEVLILAAETSKLAWRRCGQLLAHHKASGDFGANLTKNNQSPEEKRAYRAQLQREHNARSTGKSTARREKPALSLRSLGLTTTQSSYAQRLALMSESAFRGALSDWRQRVLRGRGLQLPPCLPMALLPRLGTPQAEARERSKRSSIYLKAFTARGRKDIGRYTLDELKREQSKMQHLLDHLLRDLRLVSGIARVLHNTRAAPEAIVDDVLTRGEIAAIERAASHSAGELLKRASRP